MVDMTKEEAIEYLKRADITVGTDYKTKTAIALEMAIESINNQIDFVNKLEEIKAKIEGYKSTIDIAISEDELKIEGMKEAYSDSLEIIDKCIAELKGE